MKKPVGRPAIRTASTTRLALDVDPAVKVMLKEMANANGTNMTAFVESSIRAAYTAFSEITK